MTQRDIRPWPAHAYLWATHRLYNELAWAYDTTSWLVSLGRWSGWRAAALEHVRAGPVLELGFGTGDLLAALARLDSRACGLEPSPAMQRVTARKLRRQGLTPPRLRGYAQALPFAGGSVGTVIATFPAEYILDPATWQEVARALRSPGGRFIIAGLYVEAEGPFLRALGHFASSRSAGLDDRCAQLAAGAGLRLTVIRDEARRWRAPVFVMEKG